MFKNLSYKFANLLIKNKVIENDDFEKGINAIYKAFN